jgi:hypothetical protein
MVGLLAFTSKYTVKCVHTCMKLLTTAFLEQNKTGNK